MLAELCRSDSPIDLLAMPRPRRTIAVLAAGALIALAGLYGLSRAADHAVKNHIEGRRGMTPVMVLVPCHDGDGVHLAGGMFVDGKGADTVSVTACAK
jgi:hypothetical protein